MKLTILGSRAGMPANGQPSSGYVLRHGAASILLDAGPGTATALTRHLEPHRLSAVVISHLHTDHVYDLLPLGKQLLASRTVHDPASGRAWLEHGRRVPLYAPAGSEAKFAALQELFPVTTQPWMDDPFGLAFELIEYAPGDRFTVEGIDFRLERLRHVADNCGIRLQADDVSVVYTGDTGVTEALVDLARGAGTLLAESTLETTDAGPHGHLSSADAGAAAASAGVGELILTHFTTNDDDRLAWHRDQAAAMFDGPVHIARPDRTFQLQPTLKEATA